MKLKPITKSELTEVIRDLRQPHPFGWRLCSFTVYIYNGTVDYFVHYHGQGIIEILYNGKADAVLDLTDIVKDTYTLKEMVDICYDDIKTFIECYNEEQE